MNAMGSILGLDPFDIFPVLWVKIEKVCLSDLLVVQRWERLLISHITYIKVQHHLE